VELQVELKNKKKFILIKYKTKQILLSTKIDKKTKKQIDELHIILSNIQKLKVKQIMVQ